MEALYLQYHHPKFLPGDPLAIVHRYPDPADQEVVALLAAAFASGNIKAILTVLDALATLMGPHPAAWLRERAPHEIFQTCAGIRHRWVRPEDVERLLAMLGAALRTNGSLGGLWQSLDRPDWEPDVLPALARFSDALLAFDTGMLSARERRFERANGKVSKLPDVVSILLTSPARGSACKRMNLFLRWVVRPADGIDLGLWTSFVSPARLMMPVDVHVLRAAKKLGLTRRPTPDLQAVREVTARLRKLSPADPCRYDFALVRAGIGAEAPSP